MCGTLGIDGRGGGGVGSGRPDSGEAMTLVVRPQIRERNASPAISAAFRPVRKIYQASTATGAAMSSTVDGEIAAHRIRSCLSITPGVVDVACSQTGVLIRTTFLR